MKKPTIAILSLLALSLSLTACHAANPNTTEDVVITELDPSSNASLPAGGSQSAGQRNTITVNSTESITVVPDIAEITLAVRTEHTDAAKCQQNNSDEVNQVIDTLTGLGIEESSIQTTDYYLSPLYSYANNTQKIRGYEATKTLLLSNLAIDTLGDLLKQAVQAGVTNIQSISYLSSQYDASYQEALRLAMQTSRTKAQVLAEAGGCSLGAVVGVQENSNYSDARYSDNQLASKMRASGTTEELLSDSSIQVMPGEIDVEVHITVEYLIP